MKRIRELINPYVIAFLMLILSTGILLSSCDPGGDENATPLLQAEEPPEPTISTIIETGEQLPADESIELEAKTFTIDATNGDTYAYFSFASGDIVDIEDAANSEAWDIGFQRTQVKLNGGISGPGMGSVVMLTETTFEAVTVAPAEGYRADTEDTLAIVQQSEKGWYIYTGPPTHWVLPLEDRVFVVKTAAGTFAKLRFIGYYKDNKNKEDSGFVTFEYVYQPDGSHNF